MSAWLRILPRIALRNILRQARRSTLTASAMVLGVALLMMSRALADGAHEQWIEAGVRLGTGHIAIEAPGYLESGKLEDRLDPAAVRAAEAALDDPVVRRRVSTITSRLTITGLASSAAAARPVQIMGVDPAAEAEFSKLDDRLAEGRYLKPGDGLAIYIGSELAEILDLRLGSRVVLTAQDATGEITGQLVRVVGIFKTGIPDADRGLVQIPLATARSWTGVGDALTTVAVLLHSSRQVKPVVRTLRADLAAAGFADSVSVFPWTRAMPELQAGVRLDDFGDYVFHGILFAIIALAVVNTILMSVIHRNREFGVLQALGLTPRATGWLVVTEGLMLTALSGLIGVILGVGVTWLFWRDGLDLSVFWNQDITVSGVLIDPVMVPEFRVNQVVLGLTFILIIGILGSIYPAYRATRIDVAEAMKFER